MSKPVNSLPDIDLTILGKLEAAFHSDYNIEQACRYAGISKQTYYNWLEKVEGFDQKMEDAQNKLLEKSGEVIATAINEGDASTARWFRERRDPRFKNKLEVQINPEEQALEDIIKDLTDDRNNLPDDSPRAEAKPAEETPQNS